MFSSNCKNKYYKISPVVVKLPIDEHQSVAEHETQA